MGIGLGYLGIWGRKMSHEVGFLLSFKNSTRLTYGLDHESCFASTSHKLLL